MSLLFLAEAYGAFCALTGFLVLALLSTALAWDWLRDMDARRRMNTLLARERSTAHIRRLRDLACECECERIGRLPARSHS